MSEDVRISKPGLILGAVVVAFCFVAVIVLGVFGAFCQHARAPVVVAVADAPAVAAKNAEKQQPEDAPVAESLSLGVTKEQVLAVFGPANTITPLKFVEVSTVNRAVAYVEHEHGIRMNIFHNKSGEVTGVNFISGYGPQDDLREKDGPSVLNIVRLSFIHQAIARAVDRRFEAMGKGIQTWSSHAIVTEDSLNRLNRFGFTLAVVNFIMQDNLHLLTLSIARDKDFPEGK